MLVFTAKQRIGEQGDNGQGDQQLNHVVSQVESNREAKL
jgi:hypothetical protein